MSALHAAPVAGANAQPNDVVEIPLSVRENRALQALKTNGPLRMGQLIHAHASTWRAVMGLFMAGHVELVGSDDRARAIYALTRKGEDELFWRLLAAHVEAGGQR